MIHIFPFRDAVGAGLHIYTRISPHIYIGLNWALGTGIDDEKTFQYVPDAPSDQGSERAAPQLLSSPEPQAHAYVSILRGVFPSLAAASAAAAV